MGMIYGQPLIIGGGKGNEFIVETHAGATVTATNAGATVTAIAGSDGKATLKLGKYGDWSIIATKDGIESPSITVTIPPIYLISFAPVISTTPQAGVSYTNGLNGVTAEEVSMIAAAISDNSNITNETYTLYVDYGNIHRKVSIGDQVTLSLDGTDYAFDVIGFNHDTLSAPSTAYGHTTKTGKAGITFQMHDLFTGNYYMNPNNINSGGWQKCRMRTSTMPIMKRHMPAAWQTVIKVVDKNTGKGDSITAGTITTSDECFLLAEIEIFGSTRHSVSGEGTQYAYYKAGNSKEKPSSGAVSWWERSPSANSSASFCYVSNVGVDSANVASDLRGVAFAFCV